MTSEERQSRFMILFEPQRDALWRFVRAMVRTKHDAEDVMSETILQAYQGFHSLRDEQAFTSYLFTIASRHYRRSRWRRSWFGEYNENDALAIEDSATSAETRVDVDALRSALQKLPVKQRETIVLFDLLGLSLEEIRVIQSGTLSGVKSRLVRARQELGVLLSSPQPMIDHGKQQSTSTILRRSAAGEFTSNI